MTSTIKIQSRRGFTSGNYTATISDNSLILVYEKKSVAKAAYLAQLATMKSNNQEENKPTYDDNCTITQTLPLKEEDLLAQCVSELEEMRKYNGILQKINYVAIKNSDV